jgi:hypothetical protein
LAEEVPRAVWIALEDVGRDVLREVPGRLAIADCEIDGGEVADVAAITRTDDEAMTWPGSMRTFSNGPIGKTVAPFVTPLASTSLV